MENGSRAGGGSGEGTETKKWRVVKNDERNGEDSEDRSDAGEKRKHEYEEWNKKKETRDRRKEGDEDG